MFSDNVIILLIQTFHFDLGGLSSFMTSFQNNTSHNIVDCRESNQIQRTIS